MGVAYPCMIDCESVAECCLNGAKSCRVSLADINNSVVTGFFQRTPPCPTLGPDRRQTFRRQNGNKVTFGCASSRGPRGALICGDPAVMASPDAGG